MPVIYRIIADLNFLYFRGHGVCRGEEYLEANEEAARDPLRTQDMLTLLDMRDVTELDLNIKELYLIIAQDVRLRAKGVYGSNYRTAMVVRGDLDAQMGQLYNMMGRAQGLLGVKTFATLMPALEWLGIAEAFKAVEALRVGKDAA